MREPSRVATLSHFTAFLPVYKSLYTCNGYGLTSQQCQKLIRRCGAQVFAIFLCVYTAYPHLILQSNIHWFQVCPDPSLHIHTFRKGININHRTLVVTTQITSFNRYIALQALYYLSSFFALLGSHTTSFLLAGVCFTDMEAFRSRYDHIAAGYRSAAGFALQPRCNCR